MVASILAIPTGPGRRRARQNASTRADDRANAGLRTREDKAAHVRGFRRDSDDEPRRRQASHCRARAAIGTVSCVRTDITVADLKDFLDEPLVAVLATLRPDGTVLLSPVWHEWHERRV